MAESLESATTLLATAKMPSLYPVELPAVLSAPQRYFIATGRGH